MRICKILAPYLILKIFSNVSPHPEEVSQLVLHQLSEFSPAQCSCAAILRGITVEHHDEQLHGCLQVGRHGCCEYVLAENNRQPTEKKSSYKDQTSST